MKHGYNGEDKENIIGKYEKNHNMLIVTFLDGTSIDLPLTEENEQNLLDKMLTQAKDRSNSSSLEKAKNDRKKAIKLALIQTCFTMLNGVNFCFTSEQYKIVPVILGCVTGVTAIMWGMDICINQSEIDELIKYDIYLKAKDDFDKYNEKNNNNKTEFDQININTLDNYSLKEIQTKQKQLQKKKEYSSYFKLNKIGNDVND